MYSPSYKLFSLVKDQLLLWSDEENANLAVFFLSGKYSFSRIVYLPLYILKQSCTAGRAGKSASWKVIREEEAGDCCMLIAAWVNHLTTLVLYFKRNKYLTVVWRHDDQSVAYFHCSYYTENPYWNGVFDEWIKGMTIKVALPCLANF